MEVELEPAGECRACGDVTGCAAAGGDADGEGQESEGRGFMEEERGGAGVYGEHSFSPRSRPPIDDQQRELRQWRRRDREGRSWVSCENVAPRFLHIHINSFLLHCSIHKSVKTYI